MNIASKLVTIADNMKSVYDAGYNAGYNSATPSNVFAKTIWFDDWHTGVTVGSLVEFGHGLGAKPKYVSIIANNISELMDLEFPTGVTAKIIQSDTLYNADTNEYLPKSYLRFTDAGVISASVLSGSGTEDRLIARWDENKVYVNSASTSYAWSPSSVTSYTLVCFA